MTKVEKARIFATAAHSAVDHRRKYTNEPYISHPEEVVKILYSFGCRDENMLAAAWLHDVVEDTGVSIDVIEHEFGSDVAELVAGLTDVSKPEDGNREARKKLDREHTASQSERCQIVKCADLISNTRSIAEHDPKFAKVYLKEKRLLLDVMTISGSEIWLFAHNQCKEKVK